MSESSLNSLVSLVLECKEVFEAASRRASTAAVCVDLVDLGMVDDEWNGQRKLVRKLRLLFETDYRDEAGKAGLMAKTFTASLHQKSKLAGFMGTWRGRPVVPGESVDLKKLVGASCTLVISHRQNAVGRTYAAIDAVSKPTKKVAPSGQYDPAETRRRIAEWKVEGRRRPPAGNPRPGRIRGRRRGSGWRSVESGGCGVSAAGRGGARGAQKRRGRTGARAADYDPEVGF